MKPTGHTGDPRLRFAPIAAPRSRWGGIVTGFVVLLAMFYGLFAVVTWLAGDRWWLGTVLIFSPRYLLAWPLIGLAVLIPFARRRTALAAAATIAFSIFFVCGLCLPWERVLAPSGQRLRLLTLNTGQSRIDAQRLQKLLLDCQPDIVFLQEVAAPNEIQWPENWSVLNEGELIVASRFPLTLDSTVLRELPDRWPRPVALLATAETPQGPLRLGTLHLYSPSIGLGEIVSRTSILNVSNRSTVEQEIDWRRSEAERVAAAVTLAGDDLVVGGDFNLPVDSNIYRRCFSGLRNAFSRTGFGFGNTVYVNKGGFPFGARIDHVLYRGPWRCSRCWVGPDVGSDHRAVIADLQRGED